MLKHHTEDSCVILLLPPVLLSVGGITVFQACTPIQYAKVDHRTLHQLQAGLRKLHPAHTSKYFSNDKTSNGKQKGSLGLFTRLHFHNRPLRAGKWLQPLPPSVTTISSFLQNHQLKTRINKVISQKPLQNNGKNDDVSIATLNNFANRTQVIEMTQRSAVNRSVSFKHNNYLHVWSMHWSCSGLQYSIHCSI